MEANGSDGSFALILDYVVDVRLATNNGEKADIAAG